MLRDEVLNTQFVKPRTCGFKEVPDWRKDSKISNLFLFFKFCKSVVMHLWLWSVCIMFYLYFKWKFLREAVQRRLTSYFSPFTN